MSVFDAYGHYYDLLYRDKDYATEARYVAAHIERHAPGARHILELGCGTGSHAEHLARYGYNVHGIDLSETMLARAQVRKKALPPDVAARLIFGSGDVRSVRVGKKFEVVLSLFHVMSYQTTNADLESALNTAAAHLEPGGLFLFDFWYGPAVLAQRPEVRVKRLENDTVHVTRIAEPTMYPNDNLVDVKYHVWIEDKAGDVMEQIRESHRMRYLFQPELVLMLNHAGFEVFTKQEWLTGHELDFTTWSAIFVTQRR